MTKANVRAAPIERLLDLWERRADGQLIWKEAPRDAFKNVRATGSDGTSAIAASR